MKQNRNQLLDVVKGVAILLVVLGHAVQQCSGMDGREVLDLWIERYLISFHMPLFMLVSGYLFCYSLQRHSEKEIVKERLKMFAWPILTMAVLHHLRGHVTHFSLIPFLTDFPMSLFNSLWFFWALLVITLLVCMVHRFLNDHCMGYLTITMFTLLLPDAYPLRAYVHLLPTFVVAYLFAKYGIVHKLVGGGKTSISLYILLFVMSEGIHLLMLQGFGYDDMIYFSRYSLLRSTDLWQDISRDVFRFTIGIVGSLSVLLALQLAIRLGVLKGSCLAYLKSIGSMTFGIYVFQDLMLLVLNPFAKYLNEDYYVLNSAVAFIVIFVISVVLTRLAGKKRWMSTLFLGKTK